MKLYRVSIYLSLIFPLFVPGIAHAKFAPEIKNMDRYGVSISSDINVVCDNGKIWKTTGGGTWACADDTTGSVTASADITVVCDSGKIFKTTGGGTWACADEAASGSVNSVSVAALPLVKTGTTDPVISIVSADTTTSGYLNSADWNTFNNKLGTVSADSTYLLLNNANQASWTPSSTVVPSLNADLLDGSHAAAFEPALTKGNLSVALPLSVDQSRQVIGGAVAIAMVSADTSTSGFLKSADWNTFNSKVGTASADLTYIRVSQVPAQTLGTTGSRLTQLWATNVTSSSITADGASAEANSLMNSTGIGVTSASVAAYLHIKAGTATASTAPIKLTSGTNLTTPESGVFEYDGTNLYFTPN